MVQVVQLHLRAPLYISIILCAQCNSRHTPTATSLVTAAPQAYNWEKA